MLKKLRWKFVLMATGISFIVLIGICITVLTITNTYILNKSDQMLNMLVEIEYDLNEDYVPESTIVSREFAFSTRFFVVFTDENRTIIDTNKQQIKAVDQLGIESYISVIDPSVEKGIIDDYRYLIMNTEQGYTYVFLDIEEDMQMYDIFVFFSFLIACLALMTIFLLSAFVSKRAIRPITQSIESQKRFITDASHELKTPLAIIKADTDIIEMDYGEDEWTQSIKDEIDKMDTLIKSLILLSSFDENDKELLKTSFSLSDALEETLKSFLPSLKNKQITLNTNIAGEISYLGNEESIRNLFAILLDNAIHHAPEQSNIRIALNRYGKTISIENDCDPMKPGSYNQWFERFYREDASRNSAKKGFGIGLSIAKNICDRHNIKILAKSETGKTVTIKLHF